MTLKYMIMAAMILMALIAPSQAYYVPAEYKGQVQHGYDVELYDLASGHLTEPWAQFIHNDLTYKYGLRNLSKTQERMNYEREQIKRKR